MSDHAKELRELAAEFTEAADLAVQERCPDVEAGNRRASVACLAGAEALEALAKFEAFLQQEGPLQLHLGRYMHSTIPGLAVAKGVAHAVRNWPLPAPPKDDPRG